MSETEVRDAPNPTAFRMQQAYRLVQEVVADLSEEQLRWQPNPTTPSIRFHLFHIARWGDDLQQEITGAEHQLWHAEGIAEGWGFDPAMLGVGESGEMLDTRPQWRCRCRIGTCWWPTATASSPPLIRRWRPLQTRTCAAR
jgi:hypothetical protein